MEKITEFQAYQFLRGWLAKLSSKGITSLNLEHDPGLQGMMAVTHYLEGKMKSPPHNVGERQVYTRFFQPITGWYYSKLSLVLSQFIRVSTHFQPGQGTTFDFFGYERWDLSLDASSESLPQGMSEFEEELAEVFAQAYRGNSPKK